MQTQTITTRVLTSTHVSGKLAILIDLRSPYLGLGEHPDWHRQFRTCISSPKVHNLLESKLGRFAPLVICYSKIWPDHQEIQGLSGFKSPSVCIISSVGEDNLTPWMVVHNIAHTYLSWHVSIKRDIVKLLGLDPVHYSIAGPLQRRLVQCTAARKQLIPNIAELIYELFTTWVWCGHTRSDNALLAEYCDGKFAEIMSGAAGTTVWHRYRPPTAASEVDVSGLALLLG